MQNTEVHPGAQTVALKAVLKGLDERKEQQAASAKSEGSLTTEL